MYLEKSCGCYDTGLNLRIAGPLALVDCYFSIAGPLQPSKLVELLFHETEKSNLDEDTQEMVSPEEDLPLIM